MHILFCIRDSGQELAGRKQAAGHRSTSTCPATLWTHSRTLLRRPLRREVTFSTRVGGVPRPSPALVGSLFPDTPHDSGRGSARQFRDPGPRSEVPACIGPVEMFACARCFMDPGDSFILAGGTLSPGQYNGFLSRITKRHSPLLRVVAAAAWSPTCFSRRCGCVFLFA